MNSQSIHDVLGPGPVIVVPAENDGWANLSPYSPPIPLGDSGQVRKATLVEVIQSVLAATAANRKDPCVRPFEEDRQTERPQNQARSWCVFLTTGLPALNFISQKDLRESSMPRLLGMPPDNCIAIAHFLRLGCNF